MSRGPRPLVIEPELAAALAGCRAKYGADSDPRINLDRLQDVEAALAIHFEDDVLAVMAAGVERLAARLDAVVAITGDLKAKKIPGDYVGLGEIEPGLYLCISKGRQSPGQSTVVLVDRDDGEKPRRFPVLDYIRTQGGAEPGAADDFQAVMYRPAPESTRYGRRVLHKVFGEGSLLSEQGTGPKRKCKVDFPGHGLKLLQARFLEFPDD
jgi:hypothetical protein